MLGVCANGLVVYEDEENTQSFSWPTVLNMSFKRSNFQARIFHSEVNMCLTHLTCGLKKGNLLEHNLIK